MTMWRPAGDVYTRASSCVPAGCGRSRSCRPPISVAFVSLHQHELLDVLAGALIALALSCARWAIWRRRHPVIKSSTRPTGAKRCVALRGGTSASDRAARQRVAVRRVRRVRRC